ncbi:alpha/beta hydrolase [Fervidobacterium thailandense]|uniref:AB hydrolase-1 domain-containing protein n=1 Tax=Fervidobacterium thailandense TaxID=1008305 RepID=A0A1E3G3K5_9BACT|nr:alpha/beta hydrolase [Fervidobacterium thailandense]ODN30268.1 hypothetical protein A4H02_06140 [Fervidobacterium thailandense]
MVSFDYTGQITDVTEGFIFKAKRFRVKLVKFRSLYRAPERGTEHVEYYLFDPKEEPAGLLFLLHGLGTTNIPFILWMATHLANAGIRVIVPILPGNFTRVAHGSVSGKDFFDPDPTRATKFWEQSVVDVLSIIDHLKMTSQWLDNAYMFGFCLGGMVAVMINAVRDVFKKTILMTVGGEMATLMWHSPTLSFFRRSVEKIRKSERFKEDLHEASVMKEVYAKQLGTLKEHHDVKSLQESDIHPYLKLDPIAYAKYVNRDKIIFVEALFDRALPRRSRRMLWEALGKPKRYIIPSGHVTWLPLQFFVAKFILKVMGIKELKKHLELMRKIEIEEKK